MTKHLGSSFGCSFSGRGSLQFLVPASGRPRSVQEGVAGRPVARLRGGIAIGVFGLPLSPTRLFQQLFSLESAVWLVRSRVHGKSKSFRLCA